MDISQEIQRIKQEPGFADNVGMVLVHNGIVRGWSRDTHKTVSAITVTPDNEKMNAICRRLEKEPGIFRIVAYAKSGTLRPGDDILFLIVAGDIRENVKRTFANLLDTIKKEAVFKEELIIE